MLLVLVRGIPRWAKQKASNAENVSAWWRHHVAVDVEMPVEFQSDRGTLNSDFDLLSLYDILRQDV